MKEETANKLKLRTPVTFLDKMYAQKAMTWELYAQPVIDSNDERMECQEVKPSESLIKGFINPDDKISVEWNNDYKTVGSMGIIGQATQAINTLWDKARSINKITEVTGLDNVLDKMSERDDLLGAAAGAVGGAIKNPLGILDGTKFARDFLPTKEDGSVDINTGDALMNGLEKIPYYSGADCKVTIPSLTIRYYHKMDGQTTVKEMMNRLNRRFMGKTTDLTQKAGLKGSLFAMIAPPNGFVTGELANIDYSGYLKGAFLLRIGRLELPNLLCKNVGYKLSQQRVMIYKEGVPTMTDDYLFVDITISLTPAVLYTRKTIENILAWNSTVNRSNES